MDVWPLKPAVPPLSCHLSAQCLSLRLEGITDQRIWPQTLFQPNKWPKKLHTLQLDLKSTLKHTSAFRGRGLFTLMEDPPTHSSAWSTNSHRILKPDSWAGKMQKTQFPSSSFCPAQRHVRHLEHFHQSSIRISSSPAWKEVNLHKTGSSLLTYAFASAAPVTSIYRQPV